MDKLIGFAVKWPKIWHLLKALLTVIPASLIAYVAIKWTTSSLPYQDALRAFFETNIKITLLCVIIPVALPHLFSLVDKGVVKSQESDAKSKLISAALINGLDDLVGTKLRRFADYLRGMNDVQTKGQAFDAITQPENQFVSILTVFHHILRETTQDDTIQLVMVRIAGNKTPVRFEVRIPNNLQLPNSLIEADAHKSMFHHCARQNKTMFISDIESHIRRSAQKIVYHPTGDSDMDKGSILCCPLYCETTKDVEFVLSIKSNTPDLISEKFKKLYKVPIESVKTRLLLEHHLFLIKQKAI